MGKPLSRPDCLRQNPSCLGKGEDEDGYIEDCYVPQRSIYDTMRINEQIDQGCKLNQPSKTTIDRTEIGTLSSNGTLGTSNPADAKSLDIKKLDERVIFDALKLSNDTLKSAPVPPRRRPNPDRKENVNRRSWKAFMPPNFPDFSERIEASLSEVSEAGTSNHSLHDKTEFSQLLPDDNTKHSSRAQTGSVSSTSDQSRTPVLSSAASANQSLEHTADSRCQHGQSFDYYNDSEYEKDPLLAQENATSLCMHSKPGHGFPSATWPRALKSFIKGSGSDGHHKATEMVYEECIIETLPLSPCLSDEVLDESSDFLIVPNLRQKTESELKFEEDERKILMEAEEEWEDIQSEGACSAVVTDGARDMLTGKVKEMSPIIPNNSLPDKTGSSNNIHSLPSFPDDDLFSESSHWPISEESNQEYSCYSAVSAAKMSRRRYHKLGSYSDSESDSDQLFLELEQQCQTEDDESSDLQEAVSGLEESKVNAKNVPHIMPDNNLHKTAQERDSPELDRVEENTSQLTKDECLTSALNSNDQSDVECVGETVSIVTDLTATKAQDLLTDCKEVEVNTCPANVTGQCSVSNPEEAVTSTDTLQEETNTHVNFPDQFASLVETSPSQHLSCSNEVSSLECKLSTDASEPLESISEDAIDFTIKGGEDDDSLEPLLHVYYADSHSPICDTERDSCLGSSEQPDESWTCEASFQSTDFISADSCDDVSDGGEMVICSTERSNILPDVAARETCISSMQTFTSEGELQELHEDNETSDEVDEAVCKNCSKHGLLVDGGIINKEITELKASPTGDSDMVTICDAVVESTVGGLVTTCFEENNQEYSGTETAVDFPLEPGLVETQRDCSHTNDSLTCEGAGCPPQDINKSQLCVFTDCPSALLSLDAVSENTVKDENSETLFILNNPNLDSSILQQEEKHDSFTADVSASDLASGENSLRCGEDVEDPLVLASLEFLSSDTDHQVNVPCSDLPESHEDCSEYSTASESTPDSMSPIHYADSQNNEFVQADENDCKDAGCTTQAEQNLCNSEAVTEAHILLLANQNNAHLELASEGPCARAQFSEVSDSCWVSVNTTDNGLQGEKEGGVCVPFQTAGYLSDDATCADVPSSQICTDPSNLPSGSDDEPASDKEVFQKEKVDSVQLKLQQVNGLGQGLIQSADKNCDVHGLEHDTEELNTRWNTLNKKVAERVTQLQEALLHCGKFQDALEPLLSWLTDTEDLIANQKPPSAEYKVVKAQIQEQKLLQHLLEDRRATVDMIQAEGARIAEGADPADKEKISRQLETLKERWSSLLQKAHTRQKQLDDILVLAKQFHETTEPIFDWLSATEKKLANSEPIGTQTGKIQQQILRHKSLEEDIAVHEPDVQQAGRLVDALSALCCKAEQARLAHSLDYLYSRYNEVQDLCSRKGALLGQALSNARLFGEDEVEVLNWLAEVEDKLSSVFVKDYKLEVLQKQHTDQMSLSEEIVNRKRNVDQAVKNGQALLKQTTGEEVLLIQEKLDGIKTRYSDIIASSGKALRTLEQALQLASKFQTTHEELTNWLGRVEEELAQTTGQSPAGDQIPQFQQRQKELKKEAMEYRIILDTINEVGSALLELVPWRAREGLDKLVSDANEQYRSVSSTIAHRVDQIDAAIQRSQQYEQAADAELAWVAETRRKLLALGPICLEQDQTTAQHQVQKAFTVDIIRHKDSIDELISTQEEILGTCGDEQKATLKEKTKSLLQQYEDVSHLNSERSARLERAQALLGQFWETYEELNPWIEEMQTTISQLPPPAVDHDMLRQQQEEIRQLREAVAEHKPHIDKLLKIGPHLYELNPEEGEAVQEKYTKAEKIYLAIKEEVRKMAMALDDALAQASQIVEFHDKIGPMLETLESMASRLNMPPLIPAEVDKIRDCIGENKNTLMELEKLQPSFKALKHRGEELISRSQGADTDPAAKAIQDKLDQLVFTWEDIKARVDEREMKYLDVLELAEKFWLDMNALLTTIKDTHEIVHDLESPGIDPSMIKQQIEAADTIKEESDGLHEELEFIRILGADLIFACGETEKPEVKKSIDEMNNAWENLKKTWTERLEKLRDAMAHSVQYQDNLQAMFDWLDNTVIKLCDMSPVGTDLNTVKEQINEMKVFKVEVYQQQIEMEKLNHQGELMLKKAIDDTDREIIQGPLTELKHLWENLGEKIIHRQHKLEAALLALGQFQHALAEVMSWLTHTEELLDAQKPISGDPKVIEVELAKHHVLKNDVLAHASTVQTVYKAGDELLESSAGDDANSLRTKLETLNQSWESVLQKTEEREQQLDMALQQAQGFTGEIEDFIQWESRIESQLSAAKPTGGLPETAREQLQAHMELYAEVKSNDELYKQLLDKGQLMLLSRDDAASSVTDQSVAILKRKWQNINNKVEERKGKLEEALSLATDFQNSLQDFINWLTQAEQSLNIAPPPSLILDTVLFQIDEHKIFVNEVNVHREQIIELDKTGNQLKFLSQKQDVVLIKNLLLSVQSRWEKVVQRSVDRGRSLDDARKRAKQFHEAWKKLVDWLEEAENHLDSDMDISNDPDKIKLKLTKHKEFQKTLGSKQPVYDTTVRTGRALKEKALLSDDVQKLDHLLGEVRDKWDTVCGKSVERQHKLEEALLFSGQFMDALQALVDWLYKVEPQLAEDQPVHGDLDLVMNLMDAHKGFQKELGKRTSSVQALKRSARELLESSREDTTWVKVQLQELSTRWDTVCKLSVSKQTRLEQALKQAEEFRSTVHMLLEWLSEAEQTLRFRGALPDDAEALQSLIDVHREFMKKVEEKQVDVNTAVSMGEAILTVCHPDCITTVKHWITIIRARFEEVLTWGNQHQQRLQAALSELLANSDLLDELLAWIQWAETTLIQRDQEPMPQNIDQVKNLISEHQVFMEEMTQKQPDVDRVTKTYKRKTTDPNHASFSDKTRSRKPPVQSTPPVLPLLSQSETKNPRINQLSARWQQVWLLALDRQRKLNDALDRLEELKEFANFDFDVWRKKYMRWMNHKKSRVMDFFRRIDKDQDGKITRQEFIDGILASKFPTTKLEMTAVADIFDRDGDGYIDYYEFVAALHPNKDAYRPTTDADKIEDEVTRQVAQCKCAKRFQVEQIGENKYRFGDSQQLRLVRILRSTVMVRVGGGWMALDEFLVKNDPCRARGRTNLELREKFILPEGVSQGMTPFRSRGRRSKPSSRTASPTRSSSSASQSNHSCTSVPSSPATPASGSKVTPAQSSKMKKTAIHTSRSSLTGDLTAATPSGAKSGRPDPKKSSSRAGSRTGSRASSRRGSDASDFDLLETQSACSDTSESSATGGPSRRGLSKPSKIPTMSKKTTSTPKTSGTKR